MNQRIRADEFHLMLARDVFKHTVSEEEILCLMLLLHACNIALSDRAGVSGDVRGFAPITTRHAAEVAAVLFSSTPYREPGYWYDKWNGDS